MSASIARLHTQGTGTIPRNDENLIDRTRQSPTDDDRMTIKSPSHKRDISRLKQVFVVTDERVLRILFRHRGGLLLLLVAPVVVAALRPHEIGIGTFALGAGIVMAGVALRLAAVRRIGRGARVHQPRAMHVIAAGPYRWTRNPLYLAAAGMVYGFGLLAGLGWAAPALFAATLLAYTPIVIAEEKALTALLGDAYRRYADTVPRWFGGSRPSPAALRALVPWREILRREKWLVPGSTAGVLVMAALGSERIGSGLAIQRIERTIACSLSLLAGVAMIAACGVHTVKVEVQQSRRRAAHHLALAQPAGSSEGDQRRGWSHSSSSTP